MPPSTQVSNGIVSDLAADLRQELKVLQAEEETLKNRLTEIDGPIRRYRRALALIDDEPGPLLGKPRTERTLLHKRRHPGPKVLNEIRRTIEAYAADHDEFRQVDIRAITGHSSSQMGEAFRYFRQPEVNLIRFSRREGKNHYYRLTHQAVNANG